jgi:hypothetical protein
LQKIVETDDYNLPARKKVRFWKKFLFKNKQTPFQSPGDTPVYLTILCYSNSYRWVFFTEGSINLHFAGT